MSEHRLVPLPSNERMTNAHIDVLSMHRTHSLVCSCFFFPIAGAGSHKVCESHVELPAMQLESGSHSAANSASDSGAALLGSHVSVAQAMHAASAASRTSVPAAASAGAHIDVGDGGEHADPRFVTAAQPFAPASANAAGAVDTGTSESAAAAASASAMPAGASLVATELPANGVLTADAATDASASLVDPRADEWEPRKSVLRLQQLGLTRAMVEEYLLLYEAYVQDAGKKASRDKRKQWAKEKKRAPQTYLDFWSKCDAEARRASGRAVAVDETVAMVS